MEEIKVTCLVEQITAQLIIVKLTILHVHLHVTTQNLLIRIKSIASRVFHLN